MHILNEFEQTGIEPDVVLYSALIDALWKKGSVEEVVALLDKMKKEDITLNVATYNSIIDTFKKSGKVGPATPGSQHRKCNYFHNI